MKLGTKLVISQKKLRRKNIDYFSTEEKSRIRIRIRNSEDPDPYQNDTDPEHCISL